MYWRGIVHDISKFSPSEFIPYANFFYGVNQAAEKVKRDDTGYYKPTDTGDPKFDFAWLLHQKRNRHHWQFWILPEDGGGSKVLQMERKYAAEMVCDWVGAGKAQGFFSPIDDKYLETRQWYEKNKNNMTLHPNTRHYVESIIFGGIETDDKDI